MNLLATILSVFKNKIKYSSPPQPRYPLSLYFCNYSFLNWGKNQSKIFSLKTLKQQSFVTNHKNALEVGTFCTTKDKYHCYFLKNGLISMCMTLTLLISASVPMTCLADSSSRLDLLLPQSRKNKFSCMKLSITAPLYLSYFSKQFSCLSEIPPSTPYDLLVL